MPAYTAHLNMYLPGGGSLGIGGDDEPADIDKVNQNFQKIDDWAEDSDVRFGTLETFRTAQISRNQQFTGLTADMASVSGMKTGDTYRETDLLKRVWFFDGTNWVFPGDGVFLIRPTGTVTNGTLDATTGAITFTSKTSVSVDGLFSDAYSEFLVIVELDSATATGDISMTFRVGGVAATGTYSSSGIEVAIGAGPTRRESNTVANLGRISTGGSFMELRLHNLMEAKNKRAVFSSFDNDNFHRTGGANHISTALCDGITLAFT